MKAFETPRPWLAVLVVALLLPTPAFAYIGPGAGLSLIGMAVGVLAAFGVSFMLVITWPIRALRRLLGKGEEPASKPDAEPKPGD